MKLAEPTDPVAAEVVWKRSLRLRRPMCGRAPPFRQELMESGATPQVGGKPRIDWGLPSVGQSRHRTSGGTAATGVSTRSHLLPGSDTSRVSHERPVSNSPC